MYRGTRRKSSSAAMQITFLSISLPYGFLISVERASHFNHSKLFQVLASQIGSMGTILFARKEEGLAVAPTFNVTVVFGKRNEPMLVACARQIIQYMSDTGSTKALVLSLGLRDHSMETMKAIVSTIKEKLPEIS
ncbi:uncharacterized protein [Henckelia pumila]|uniref:uncharacterized protein isoform X1 n=1 Tax=Henckelia pumila TaxID=405737 RepID=UPI003C6E9948